jgi:argininosuccinate lyase
VTQKTWGGRFEGGADPRVEAFTESISLDRRLYRHDVRASQAHARMLAEVGLLSADEATRICNALDDVAALIERGELAFSAKLEDVHSHIEDALIQRLGDVGRKLHTGRSRNDQVVTDVKLWVRDAVDRLDSLLNALQSALLGAAERHRGLVLPGYTHLQRAQPVLAAHYFLAYVEKYQRDRERLADARKRVNVLPLGAAALAGTSLPIDRDSVRRQLGFDALTANSLDASGDRDFLLEFVFDLSVIALHLSGWAEEWVLWSTTEFGFLELPEAFCTGSSIMPHKKNPDVLELIRGKSARVVAALQQLMVLVKGLPLAYNRDLQEDKHALFDAYDTVEASLELAAALVEGANLRAEVIEDRLDLGFLDATTLMEYCVAQGMPMRSAHEAVGKLVRLCEQRRCRLVDLMPAEYESVRQGLSAGVYKVLGVANALAAFRSAGSTAPAEVEKQLTRWRRRLQPDQNHQAAPAPAVAPPFKWQPPPAAPKPAAPKTVRLAVRDDRTQAAAVRDLGVADAVWARGVTIGADPDCDLVLEGPGVAGKQAQLTWMNRHVFLKALAEGARIGASVIGVGEKRLIDAREFQIAHYTLRLAE